MVLFYEGNDPSKAQRIKRVLEHNQIPFKSLSDADLNTDMKDLRVKEESGLEAGCSQNPFLFYDDLARAQIEPLEKALNEADANIPYKAVATQNNLGWSLRELMEEVCAEAAYFAKRNHLYDLVEQADASRLEEDDFYRTMMVMAYSLLDSQCDEEDLDMAIEAIESYN